MKQALVICFGIVIVIGLLVGVLSMQFLSTRPSPTKDTVLFEVEPGQSFKAIAHDLEAKNLITNAIEFQILARLDGQANKVRVGEYAIRRDSLPREVLKTITSGKSVEYVVTIQEGLNKYEIAALLERSGYFTNKEFLFWCDNKAYVKELLGENLPSFEGYLFPETYHFTKFTGAKGFVRLLVMRFLDTYSKIPPNPDLKLSRHQIVTLASIVEKETGATEERPIVASVFHNRLKNNMKLQTDPTVVYGILDANKPYDGNIHKTDLLNPSRYNTYTMLGLPFGPIANPGKEALEATIHPAQTEFFFFVSRNNGTHIFSKDYSQHLKAVSTFQLDPKARQGHSWRELSKKQTQKKQLSPSTPAANSNL
jgi:UPF0755 protein